MSFPSHASGNSVEKVLPVLLRDSASLTALAEDADPTQNTFAGLLGVVDVLRRLGTHTGLTCGTLAFYALARCVASARIMYRLGAGM